MSSIEKINAVDKEDLKIMTMGILGMDVTEIYSPERVNKVCERYGLTKGSSMDLTNGWDLT